MLASLLFTGLLQGGCTRPEAVSDDEMAAIEASLREYLPRLAEAYAVADLEALRSYASENRVTDARVLAVLDAWEGRSVPPLRERLESILGEHAAEKEIAGLQKRLDDLLAESRVIRPTFQNLEVADVQVWNYANAFVTTLEAWDLRVYAAGTDEVLSRALDQTNRVKYQMKRDGDGWLVLFRELETAFE